jgi:hypothetical protein
MTTLILAKYDDNDELIITNHVSLGVRNSGSME